MRAAVPFVQPENALPLPADPAKVPAAMTRNGSPEILVTGGCGFIGRHLVRALRAEGRSVRVLARDPARVESVFGPLAGGEGGVEAAPGDLGDAAAVRRAVAGVGEIFHVGGVYRFGPRRAVAMEAANVRGTEHVLAAAWAEGVQRVVHVSSAGLMHGCGAGPRGPLTERDFPSRPPRCAPYKASKWRAERVALDYARRGLPVVVASPPCPIGAEDEGPTPTGRMVLDFIEGNFPFSARTGLNFIAVEDLAAGMIACARHGRTGERYLLGDENLWLDDLLGILSGLTGRPAPRWRLPWAVIALAGVCGETAGSLHAPFAERVCLETALKARHAQFIDSAKARTELGWEPRRPLRDALADAVAWFRARQMEPAARGVVEAEEAELPAEVRGT